jgi:pimeloyl-ACP methyl ester carboxylesterase
MRLRIPAWAVVALAATLVIPLNPGVQAQSGNPATTATGTNSNQPLVLAKQGSFFVNEQNIASAFPSATGTPVPGHISAKGMYVQYEIPAARNRGAYPIIMVHGAGHTGKTYEETPDGRMGWAEYFVRRGIPVYVVDHSGRARSGFDPTPSNRAKLESNPALIPSFVEFTNEQAWTVFRFGPAAFTPYENTRFPIKAQDQYFAQMVPNTETSYPDGGQSTIAALGALLDRIGPAVVMVHSQSGAYGLGAAIDRPNLAKAVVSIEPRSCEVSDENVKAVFTRVKLLTMFGDFFGSNVGDWPGRMAECVDAVTRIKGAGGVAENIYLPDRGIRGNSHLLMMDLNNQQLADIILGWLADKVRVR